MPLTLLNIILIIAASQGIFLAILIYFRHGTLFANRFLALYIFVYSLIIIDLLVWDLHLYAQQPYLRIAMLSLPFVMVPLHYLYAKYLSRSRQSFQRRDLLHFLPVPTSFALFIAASGASRDGLVDLLTFNEQTELPLPFLLFNWAILLETFVYFSLTLLLLRHYQYNIKQVFSNVGRVQLDWLRNLTLLMVLVVTFFLIENILLLINIQLSDKFNLSSAVVAISVYIIGYLGMGKSDIFINPKISRSMQELPHLNVQLETTDKKYSKSGLSPETAQAYVDELLAVMQEDKPYRDSDLTLPQLASRLGISTHNLSQALNSTLEQNFFDFVNSYRVNEVIESFKDPKQQHLKILALAFDAGFNSKTTFNSIFKKFTGKTPSEYRQTLS